MTEAMLWMPSSEQALTDLLKNARELGFEAAETDVHQETWYDTFDWRLLAEDLVLVRRKQRMFLVKPQSLTPCTEQVAVKSPFQFVWDLPESSVRQQLTKLAEMRALLPVLRVERKTRHFHLLDDERKTRVRLAITTVRALKHRIGAPFFESTHQQEEQEDPLATTLLLEPLKGYESDFEKARQTVEPFVSNANHQRALMRCLRAAGLQPLDYQSKPALGFTAKQPSRTAPAMVLRAALGVIRRNLTGLRADIDTEFLHDFRVATRRTRAAIAQLKGALPTSETDAIKSVFKILGGHTNRLRDLDVYLLGRNDYLELVPKSFRDDLNRFFDYLEGQREEALAEVRSFLSSTEFRDLLQRWSNYAEQDPVAIPGGPKGNVPLGKLARKIVRKRYQRIQRDGSRLSQHSPDDHLHDLRLQCKKLRYALELFDNLFDPEAVQTAVKDLKRLQTRLGDFNDYSVQQETLRDYATSMKLPPRSVRPTMLAMGFLVSVLHGKQRKCRKGCLKAVNRFIGPDTQEHFVKLLDSVAVTS